MGLLVLFPVGLVLAGLVFYFCKSSKEMPKNWKELVVEFQVQRSGVEGIAEDIFLRSRNKIGELPTLIYRQFDSILLSPLLELYKQPNKIVVMTGGNRGLGICVVEKLLKCDMTVLLGVRNPEEAKKSIEKAIDINASNGKLFFEKCDTEDMESVRNFAGKVKERFSKIHILINNAGVMSVPYKETKDGFESHMAINYLGHFLLTHLLLPLLKAGGREEDEKNARIIHVSSCVHRLGNIDYDDFHRT